MLFDETYIAHIIIGVIGLAFVLTSGMWMHHIYNIFMKRRYKNMEGFRETRG